MAAAEFHTVARADDIPPGMLLAVQVDEQAIAIANVGGEFFATQGHCLHLSGPLGHGRLEGTVLSCPWHGWQYDVTTGKLVQNPSMGVACYPTEVRGEEVFVDVG